MSADPSPEAIRNMRHWLRRAFDPDLALEGERVFDDAIRAAEDAAREEGAAAQAILEVRGRARFLAELREKHDAELDAARRDEREAVKAQIKKAVFYLEMGLTDEERHGECENGCPVCKARWILAAIWAGGGA